MLFSILVCSYIYTVKFARALTFIDAYCSSYTNTVARLALEFGVEAAGVLGESEPSEWTTIANGLVIPFDPVVPGHPEMKGGYHPE